MKALLIILLANVGLGLINRQSKEFVCLPCGRECDNQIYKEAGKCSSCQMTLVEKSSIHFANLSIDDFCKRINTNPNAVILDVRSAQEYNGTSKEVATFGHFKNAINVNVSEIESKVKELEKYKAKEILVYCSHAHRSAVASYFLSTHGFSNVKNMLGGVSAVDPVSPCLKDSFLAHSH